MSDESKKLNPEQKKVEASLGRFPLPKSSINRDELMYQSGWAAALASLEYQTGVTKATPLKRDDSWVWRATALLTSAAAVVLGVLLMIQSGQSPNTTQIADNDAARSNESVKKLPVDESPESFNDSTENRFHPKTDIVERMLEYPSGKILTSGLSFQSSAMASQPFTPKVDESELQTLNSDPVGQRRLLQELLPAGRRPKSAWPSFSF